MIDVTRYYAGSVPAYMWVLTAMMTVELYTISLLWGGAILIFAGLVVGVSIVAVIAAAMASAMNAHASTGTIEFVSTVANEVAGTIVVVVVSASVGAAISASTLAGVAVGIVAVIGIIATLGKNDWRFFAIVQVVIVLLLLFASTYVPQGVGLYEGGACRITESPSFVSPFDLDKPLDRVCLAHR